MIPGGVSGQLLGVDAVREFNVLENTYGAEYGKRPGGQVSLVTMSGSNQFHGGVFEFLRNSALDARDFFAQTSAPPFKRNQFGGSAGGPIKKDKTFVFGSYEGFRQRLALSSVAVVPDNNARQGYLPGPGGTLNFIGLAPGIAPFFSLWPVQNGPELGGGAAFSYSNPVQAVREDFGNFRIDHSFTAKDSLFGVYSVDDGVSRTPGANPLQNTLSVLRAQVASIPSALIRRLGFGGSGAGGGGGSTSPLILAHRVFCARPIFLRAAALNFLRLRVDASGVAAVRISAAVVGAAISSISRRAASARSMAAFCCSSWLMIPVRPSAIRRCSLCVGTTGNHIA